jgi:hypothetical protein
VQKWLDACSGTKQPFAFKQPISSDVIARLDRATQYSRDASD